MNDKLEESDELFLKNFSWLNPPPGYSDFSTPSSVRKSLGVPPPIPSERINPLTEIILNEQTLEDLKGWGEEKVENGDPQT